MATRDHDCVRFLQWALPRLRYRWPGFRKPRRQVCRRVLHRCRELGLQDLDGYRRHLEAHPPEWEVLDSCCRVTISRFRRDHSVWDHLVADVLPELVDNARTRIDPTLRAWSCGCASGEEASTLAIAWELVLGSPVPLKVLGTDLDPTVLGRAENARYPAGSLKELPEPWRSQAFEDTGDGPSRWRLRPRFRRPLSFCRQDLRRVVPSGPFDLVMCRNLAFTYFDDELQREVLGRLLSVLAPGGALVIGRSESLLEPVNLERWVPGEGIYRLVPA